MTSDDPHPKASTGRPSLWDEAQAPNFFTPSLYQGGLGQKKLFTDKF